MPGSGWRFEGWKAAGEHDEARDAHLRRSPGHREAMVGGEDAECLDAVLGDMSAGRVVRPLASQEGKVPAPGGGDGVEGETPAQFVGRVDAAVLDAGADLQRVEEPLDPPAQFVPAQHRAGGVEVGLAPVVSRIQCSGWFVFRFFDAGSAGRRGGSSARAQTAIMRTSGSFSRSFGGSRSTGVQRRVRFAMRPRRRFGPPQAAPSLRMMRLDHRLPAAALLR